MTDTYSIADVERDTGLGKDTLRVWERRYGFPRPRRDKLGERLYTPAQVEKLRVIKRLLDAGHRPAALVSRPLPELRTMSREAAAPAATTAVPRTPQQEDIPGLLDLVRRHDAGALLQALALAEARLGLRRFVTEVAAPCATEVGEAWMRGELRIFEEHLFTECMQVALRSALGKLPAAAGPPRVLLATLPGEPHGLGLLMAQTVLALEGCRCLSLGVQVPVAELAAAAQGWSADIVALSVTGCTRRAALEASLQQLRKALPQNAALWVGGAAPTLPRHPAPGVLRLPGLAAIEQALLPWRPAPGAGHAG